MFIISSAILVPNNNLDSYPTRVGRSLAYQFSDEVISEGGSMIDVECTSNKLAELLGADSGIDQDAFDYRSDVLSEGGIIVSFDCINTAVIDLKSIDV